MARQRGAIIRRGKTYYIKYRTPAGKQKWESGFPNRSQAQQRLNQLLGEITHGSYVEPKSTKFEKFAEEWLESRVAVRGSTLSSYGSIIRRRLIPHIRPFMIGSCQGQTELSSPVLPMGLLAHAS